MLSGGAGERVPGLVASTVLLYGDDGAVSCRVVWYFLSRPSRSRCRREREARLDRGHVCTVCSD